MPKAVADQRREQVLLGRRGARSGTGQAHALVHDVQVAFAHSTQTVFYIMAAVMAATFLVALRWLPRGRVELPEESAVPALAATPPG